MRSVATVLILTAVSLWPVLAQQPSPSIEVPPGQKAILKAKGKGVQIYSCTATPDGATWKLTGPDAKLFSGSKQIGTHSAGPTWTLNDGSTVKAQKKASKPAPKKDHAVDWLLLDAVPESGTGKLAKVKFIRRTKTHGGVPDPAGCKTASDVGKPAQVPYTATYTFYADQH